MLTRKFILCFIISRQIRLLYKASVCNIFNTSRSSEIARTVGKIDDYIRISVSDGGREAIHAHLREIVG